MANVGYCRVSTTDQHPALQHDALEAAGCVRVFSDAASGSPDSRPDSRPGLSACLDFLRAGDTLVVWKLDRLGRSLPHLLSVVGDLEGRDVQFRSLTEQLDTSTPGGRLVFHVFAALAQFERELIVARTQAGLEAARRRGRHGGRPRVLAGERLEAALAMRRDGKSSRHIARVLGVGRTTVDRHLRRLAP